ncbi:alternative ribosome rescue aminoacyl-tRNA hydrolase ArfB [Paucibacter sp. B51]|uniref:alternative ribosome rescue aminoacyl-tRNA hydrolase ArfB n=1 Tax=Paucibacter sp. B51 TaxID=2993315 RepID=UPI001D011C38|nr:MULTISPECIES: alternative ribosome rescue aminoacyl-tRNA hydrolase ArfB [Pseudomonadota]
MPARASEHDVDFSAIRSSGPGGQNVHKVSSAVHLRFDIRASSLPADVKARLLSLSDHRVTKDGEIVIKVQTSRSHEKNRTEALARLNDMIQCVSLVRQPRRATTPTFSSKQRRLKTKASRSEVKAGRGKVSA